MTVPDRRASHGRSFAMRRTRSAQTPPVVSREPRSRAASARCGTAAATPADLPYIDRLRRADDRALGFLSRAALAEKVRLGHVRLAVADGRVVGYLLHGSMRRPEVRVFQLAIDPSCRGRGIGRRLVADLVRRSAAAGARGISLRCREELPANQFWHRAGFELHDLEPARRGALFVWVRRVTVAQNRRARNEPTATINPASIDESAAIKALVARNEATAFRFHSRWHPCRACGRMTCDTWSAGAKRQSVCVDCAAQLAPNESSTP
jgi:ribosomal protein S18 acetylase RimI-like enzyme